MLGFDMDKMVQAITHPFVHMLEDFDRQMAKLHEEVTYTNSLLEGIKNALENQGKSKEGTQREES